MTSLELIIGFLGVPTLGAVVLVLLAHSRRALDRVSRAGARRWLGWAGWLLYAHVGFFVLMGLASVLNNPVWNAGVGLAWLARIVGITLIVLTAKAAIKVSQQHEALDPEDLPLRELREQEDQKQDCLTYGLILICFPLFVPALLALTLMSIFLLLEDLVRGASLVLRENRLLWTLALAVQRGDNPAQEVYALAAAMEAERRRSLWRYILGWGRGRVIRLQRLADDLDRGLSIAKALHLNRGLMSPEMTGVIAVAERGNQLSSTLVALASRQAVQVNSSLGIESVYGTVFYVWAIWAVFVQIAGFIMIWIIPKYKDIFEGFGTQLPRVTQLMERVSDVSFDYWWFVFPMCSLPFLALLLIQRLGTGNHRGLRWLLHWFPRLESPFLLSQLSYVVADQRSLAPELEVLSDLERVGAYRARLERLQVQVESGIPLSMALYDEGFVSVREAAALESATALRHLPWTLRAIANKMLDRRQQAIRWFLTIGEPLLLIFMGLLVGLFTIGMFLPIVKLLNDLT